jgi:hypothetical protein
VPEDVLGQLGHRVQHALRAFTPDDEKALKAAARTFPKTTHYDIEATLTTLGIGEALVTVLAANGVPTMPFVTRLIPPASRMGPLTDAEMAQRLGSPQVKKYATAVDRESAREMLAAKMTEPVAAGAGTASPSVLAAGSTAEKAAVVIGGLAAALNSPLVKTIAGRATTQVMRGLMGALIGTPSRRRRY